MMKNLISLLFALSSLLVAITEAPDRRPEGSADEDPLAWLDGHWVGKGFGGQVEEFWSPSLNGTRMCVFRLVVNGEVRLYEMVTLAPTEDGHEMRLRHFDHELNAWEERTSPLVWEVTELGTTRLAAGPVVYDYDPDQDILKAKVLTSSGSAPAELILRRAAAE